MNDYIINPWFFYWLNVADSLLGVFILLMMLTGVAIAIAGIAWATIYNESCYEKEVGLVKRIFKWSVVSFVLCVPLVIFIPSKTTLIQMAVASQVTESNVKVAKKEAIGLIDYVIEKVDRL